MLDIPRPAPRHEGGAPLVERRGFGGKTGIHPPLAGGGQGGGVCAQVNHFRKAKLMQPVMLRRALTFPRASHV